MFKIYLPLFIFLSVTLQGHAQSFGIEFGFGLGSTLESGSDANSKARGMLYAGGYYPWNERFSLGLEVSTAGSLIRSLGGDPSEENFDQATNTTTLDASNMNANTQLIKGKYAFDFLGFRSFTALGVGRNVYFLRFPVREVDVVKKSNLAIMSEFGVTANHFILSLRYLVGGRTPDFTYTDEEGLTTVLRSKSISPFFFTIGYRIDL